MADIFEDEELNMLNKINLLKMMMQISHQCDGCQKQMDKASGHKCTKCPLSFDLCETCIEELEPDVCPKDFGCTAGFSAEETAHHLAAQSIGDNVSDYVALLSDPSASEGLAAEFRTKLMADLEHISLNMDQDDQNDQDPLVASVKVL